MSNPLQRIYRGARRAMRVVSRPVRRDRGLKGVVIQPYRGYGTPQRVYLMGRVFRQPHLGRWLPPGTVFREVSDVVGRFSRWGLGEVTVSARLGGTERSFTTDRDGYFRIDLQPDQALDTSTRWHRVHLEAHRRGETATAEGLVYVPPPSARLLVISDIDDTVMFTGVANKAQMFWRLFVQDAESRVAFPGVSALYRGLHEGPGGGELNPMIYVSRAPWSIYEVLESFFRLKDIPEGPVLFLREWGLSVQRPLPRRAKEHKRDLITGALERYPDLPVLLIGDSGQHDPEVYARIVREHPGRIAAVYIRDVSRSKSRSDEIGDLAREMHETGSPLVLSDDTLTMAEHAVEAGFISAEGAAAVAEAQRE